MTYTPQTHADLPTVAGDSIAKKLNHIEDGIVAAGTGGGGTGNVIGKVDGVVTTFVVAISSQAAFDALVSPPDGLYIIR